MIQYSELDSRWTFDADRDTWVAPIKAQVDYQRLVFNEIFRDGEISTQFVARRAEMPSGETRSDVNYDSKVGALIFRFQNPKNYYFAGIGGYDKKFFISEMVDGKGRPLATTGTSETIGFDENYAVKIRCSGNRIALLYNNIVHLEIFDNTFASGQWGLQAWRSLVEFQQPESSAAKPRCFVIMPFAAEFDSVYEVIRQTVVTHDFECIRADRRYLVGSITEDINEQIRQADLVVADLTGKNPNVFYEVGYAAALQKPVIQIAQSLENLPFDVRHLRTFAYSTAYLADRKLADDLTNAIRVIA